MDGIQMLTPEKQRQIRERINKAIANGNLSCSRCKSMSGIHKVTLTKVGDHYECLSGTGCKRDVQETK